MTSAKTKQETPEVLLGKKLRAEKIRNDLREGVLTNSEIAAKHGVSPAAVTHHASRLRRGPVARRKHPTGMANWRIDGDTAIYTNRRGIEIAIDTADFAVVGAGRIDVVEDYRGYKSVYYRVGQSRVPLARFLLKAEDGFVADHIDGNSLNNRRSNLRLCTRAENARNSAVRGGETSQYKGVNAYYGVWRASISHGGTVFRLGSFKTEKEAAEAYDQFARALHGEFACLNFPQADERPALRVVGRE